jgi:hypothetical protein
LSGIVGMKKATVGMILLGAMVFTKAFLLENNSSQNMVSRDATLTSNVNETLIIRSQVEDMISEPQLAFFVSNYSLPHLKIHQQPRVNSVNSVIPEIFVEEVATINNQVQMEKEIIPMDYASNTGYGIWKSTSEQIISKEDRDGAIPLDRGNTITDNISKLFPRNP